MKEESKEQDEQLDESQQQHQQREVHSPAIVSGNSSGSTASRRPSRLTATDHTSSSSHLIDVLPAASMPATSLSSNPTHQPITAERALPRDYTAATGH